MWKVGLLCFSLVLLGGAQGKYVESKSAEPSSDEIIDDNVMKEMKKSDGKGPILLATVDEFIQYEEDKMNTVLKGDKSIRQEVSVVKIFKLEELNQVHNTEEDTFSNGSVAEKVKSRRKRQAAHMEWRETSLMILLQRDNSKSNPKYVFTLYNSNTKVIFRQESTTFEGPIGNNQQGVYFLEDVKFGTDPFGVVLPDQMQCCRYIKNNETPVCADYNATNSFKETKGTKPQVPPSAPKGPDVRDPNDAAGYFDDPKISCSGYTSNSREITVFPLRESNWQQLGSNGQNPRFEITMKDTQTGRVVQSWSGDYSLMMRDNPSGKAFGDFNSFRSVIITACRIGRDQFGQERRDCTDYVPSNACGSTSPGPSPSGNILTCELRSESGRDILYVTPLAGSSNNPYIIIDIQDSSGNGLRGGSSTWQGYYNTMRSTSPRRYDNSGSWTGIIARGCRDDLCVEYFITRHCSRSATPRPNEQKKCDVQTLIDNINVRTSGQLERVGHQGVPLGNGLPTYLQWLGDFYGVLKNCSYGQEARTPYDSFSRRIYDIIDTYSESPPLCVNDRGYINRKVKVFRHIKKFEPAPFGGGPDLKHTTNSPQTCVDRRNDPEPTYRYTHRSPPVGTQDTEYDCNPHYEFSRIDLTTGVETIIMGSRHFWDIMVEDEHFPNNNLPYNNTIEGYDTAPWKFEADKHVLKACRYDGDSNTVGTTFEEPSFQPNEKGIMVGDPMCGLCQLYCFEPCWSCTPRRHACDIDCREEFFEEREVCEEVFDPDWKDRSHCCDCPAYDPDDSDSCSVERYEKCYTERELQQWGRYKIGYMRRCTLVKTYRRICTPRYRDSSCDAGKCHFTPRPDSFPRYDYTCRPRTREERAGNGLF